MKRTLIVDDEKLVRKGIISTLPWEKYGFVISGEAGNVETALDFIRNNEVDLLVTDLVMPGRSGLDLIKLVKEEYPHINSVILTCHESFKYLQDAVRLGVTEYIIKTEIDDDTIENTLKRISDRIHEENNDLRPEVLNPSQLISFNKGILICGKSTQSDISKLLHLNLGFVTKQRLVEIDKHTWFLPDFLGINENKCIGEMISAFKVNEWAIARITDIEMENTEAFCQDLRSYRWRELFFEYEPEKVIYDFSMKLWGKRSLTSLQIDYKSKLISQWNKLSWIYDDAIFENLLSITRELTTSISEKSISEIRSIFYNIVLEWDRLLDLGTVQNFLSSFDEFFFWNDCKTWLRGFRKIILEKVKKNSTNNMLIDIMQAIENMKVEKYEDLNESDIAKSVNMSRGYFSYCFKKVTGKSYKNYVKDLKIDKAKWLLLRTSETISLIAEKCGFDDHRYFCRVFRESVGILPTEYRNCNKKTRKD